jgi:hypothetical protein
MNTGNETWKWGVVFILLAIFLVTANQAYVHVTSQEDYAPPDDYKKGDSWDLEHQGGPGAGQAMQMQENPDGYEIDPSDMPQTSTPKEESEELPELHHGEEIDWNQVPIPAGD